MEPFLAGAVLLAVSFGVSEAFPPVSDAAWTLTPLEAAQMAVKDYNEGTGVPAVFRSLKLRNAHKERFGWGVHFSLNFTVKETQCQKTPSYRMRDCRYKPKGAVRDCSAEVSILNFMDDSPLTSVKCQRLGSGGRKTAPSSRPQAMEALPPRVHVEYYFPSSYSTAALTAVEDE